MTEGAVSPGKLELMLIRHIQYSICSSVLITLEHVSLARYHWNSEYDTSVMFLEQMDTSYVSALQHSAVPCKKVGCASATLERLG
jgi:hypothetical protein